MEQGKRPALLRELVACLLNCERWSEALKAIGELRKLEKNDESLYLQEISLMLRLGQTKKAWSQLKEGAYQQGTIQLQAKSILLLGESRHEEALPLFKKLVEYSPDNGDHWLN